jgi:hypothetical protein
VVIWFVECVNVRCRPDVRSHSPADLNELDGVQTYDERINVHGAFPAHETGTRAGQYTTTSAFASVSLIKASVAGPKANFLALIFRGEIRRDAMSLCSLGPYKLPCGDRRQSRGRPVCHG